MFVCVTLRATSKRMLICFQSNKIYSRLLHYIFDNFVSGLLYLELGFILHMMRFYTDNRNPNISTCDFEPVDVHMRSRSFSSHCAGSCH